MSLRNKLDEMRNRMESIKDQIEAFGSLAEKEGRDITDDELSTMSDLSAEFKALEDKSKGLEAIVNESREVARARVASESIQNALTDPTNRSVGIPASLRGQRTKHFESNQEAYAMGRWLMGLVGDESSKAWAIKNGFDYRNDQSVGDPGLGGATVPTPLLAAIVRLIEEYGVFRQFSRNIPMSAMTLDVPRRTGGLTVRYPGEGNPINPSDVSTDQISLVAKKYALLNIMSTELVEDAIISWTDLVAEECAWALALAEDTNSFLGDGTATFGGITGIASALGAGGTVTGGAGLWGGVDLGRLEEMAGLPPAYAGFRGRWYMSRYAYFTVVVSLLNAAGGTDMRQIEAGGEMMLMGYPVTFTQVLPGKNAANGDLGIVFGDLSLGSMLGVRRQISLRLLTELYAASDQLGMVCTMRSDTNIHDAGDATDAGAIVGLVLST